METSSSTRRIKIGRREVGPDCKTFIIAEAGVNHNGDLERAREMVLVAARSGADAIKFQTFSSDKLASSSTPKADYQSRYTKEGSQLDLLKSLELKAEDFDELKTLSEANGIEFMSSPFEEDSIDLLDALGVLAFKIPSGEVTNPFFLEYIAKKNKPIILSTGMCSLEEVRTAVEILYHAGNSQLIVLHCVSSYPAPVDQVNLRAMDVLRDTFAIPVGFSDHTLGLAISFAAVARGACVIEKHFTLDRSLPGPDHQASLEPYELNDLVSGIRSIELSLGDGCKKIMPCEFNTAAVARKSIVSNRNITAGQVLSFQDLAVRRPGTGLAPSSLKLIVGRTALVDIAAGVLISSDMLETGTKPLPIEISAKPVSDSVASDE